MLAENLNPMDINPREAGSLFGEVDIDDFDSTLRAFFKIKGRAGFCEFLGIRESTLSGWFKAGDLPYYAKVAFGLAVAFESLKANHQSLINKNNLPVIVNLGEHWGLMEIQNDTDGTSTGKILASGITSEEDARRLLSSIKGSQLFVKSMPQIFSGFDSNSLDYDTDYEEYDEDSFVMKLFESGTDIAQELGLSESLIEGLQNESMGGVPENPLVNIALKILKQHSSPNKE